MIDNDDIIQAAPLSCEQARPLMRDFALQKLENELHGRLRAHLFSCLACNRVFRQTVDRMSDLGELPKLEVPSLPRRRDVADARTLAVGLVRLDDPRGQTSELHALREIRSTSLIAMLKPKIEEYRGTLLNAVDAGMLAVFDDVNDAAGCAIVMQRAVEAQNRRQQRKRVPDATDLHISIGIHYGKTIIHQSASGELGLRGDVIHIAAQTTADAAMDEILLTGPAAGELNPPGCTNPVSRVPHVTKISAAYPGCETLLWREREISAQPRGLPRDILSRAPIIAQIEMDWLERRKSGPAVRIFRYGLTSSPDLQLYPDFNTGGVHGLHIDHVTGKGLVRPVFIRLHDADPDHGRPAGIRPRLERQQAMQPTAKAAIEEAFAVLLKLDFRAATADAYDLEWWIAEEPGAPLRDDGGSLGLAISVATVAAYTGVRIKPEVLIAGAPKSPPMLSVTGAGSKWHAARRDGFKLMVLPHADRQTLPAEAADDEQLRVLLFAANQDAILNLLGRDLGRTSGGAAAAPTTVILQDDWNGADVNANPWHVPTFAGPSDGTFFGPARIRAGGLDSRQTIPHRTPDKSATIYRCLDWD
jgi:hypothetical protein